MITRFKIFENDDPTENMWIALGRRKYWDFMEALEKGADINNVRMGKWFEENPLIYATYSSQKDMVVELLKKGADPFWIYKESEVEGTIDFYHLMEKLFPDKEKKKIRKVLFKIYPNFLEERELRLNANKYNL
jgi:hypothetical protein